MARRRVVRQCPLRMIATETMTAGRERAVTDILGNLGAVAPPLIVLVIGMVVLDLRFRLFFGRAPRRAAIVLVLGVAFFLAWDLAGVGLHIFFRGGSGWLLGVQLAPEVPLEELFFLTLLCYLTMNVYGALTRPRRGPA